MKQDLKLKRVVVVTQRPKAAVAAVAGVFGTKAPTLEQRKVLRKGKHMASGFRKV